MIHNNNDNKENHILIKADKDSKRYPPTFSLREQQHWREYVLRLGAFSHATKAVP